MMQIASSFDDHPLRLRSRSAQAWQSVEEDSTEVEDENCPVICADEIFFGSSGSKNLRVVCFANALQGRYQRRRVS